jgi:hypothetical protein
VAILQNETLVNAREIPFHLADANDPIGAWLTGYAWPSVGGGLTDKLQVRLPGGAYTNATIANIREIGFGDYALQLALADTATRGTVGLFWQAVGAQPGTTAEIIASISDGIMVGETDDTRRELWFHMPSDNDPLTGVAGHVWAAGEVKIAAPGGIYVDADVARVVDKGNGDYALRLTDLEVANRGKVYLRAVITGAQAWSAAYDIVPASQTLTLGAPNLNVLTTFSTTFKIARLTQWQSDLTSIPVGSQIIVLVKYEDRNEWYVARNAEGAWKWPFDVEGANDNSLGPIGVPPVRLKLKPRGGWPACSIEVQVVAGIMAVEV